MLKKMLIAALVLLIPVVVGGAVFLVWGYHYITRDLPQLSRIEDYKPPMVSTVYAADGTLIGEFYNERRYPARLKEVPVVVRNCFLAAEDSSFYHHPGIDLISIVRAFIRNMQTGKAKQGGSTITQQVVKNLLLSSEKKITRKIKEAILSYQLEQRLSKDDILEIYLNQIFFGNGAYGIKAAARLYFHKELSELTLAEGAMLAGLPKAPSRYSPISNMRLAKERQRYVLDQMVKANFITPATAKRAKREEISVYRASSSNFFSAPYYLAEVRRIFSEKWPEYDLDSDGLQIFLPVDLKAEDFARAALQRGLREVDKRRGWRGPIDSYPDLDEKAYLKKYRSKIHSALRAEQIYPALVTQVSANRKSARVSIGEQEAILDLQKTKWARRRVERQGDGVSWIKPEREIRRGDVVEVVLAPKKEKSEKAATGSTPTPQVLLDQTPNLEGALVLLDPNSGRVVSMIGGFDYTRSQFNRVTQSYRQPGSAFKPVVYLAAVDGFNYTPATIVYDEPRVFRVGDDLWEPGNFDHKFLGGITLRFALEKSRNLVSADIISRIGVSAAIQYARKLGIKSRLGQNLSLSLGSSEVTLLEIARAYGVFANKGVLFDSVFVDRILDRSGKEVFNYEDEKFNQAQQVISEESAFLMANMMKGVVQRGTGWRVRELERPVAGKTGTSNDLMDAWFIGYTPEWVCGVWVGFDLKKSIGDKETGGRVSSPVWLDFMGDFLEFRDAQRYAQLEQEARDEAEELGIEYVSPEKLEPLDFSVPEGVDPSYVSRVTGLPSAPGDPDAIHEYFVKGTEPIGTGYQEETSSYLDSPEL